MSSCQSKNAKRDRSVRVIFRKGFKVRPHSEQSGSSGAQLSPGNRASPQLAHQPRSDVFIFIAFESFHNFECLSSRKTNSHKSTPRPRRDTGQSTAPVSLSIHFPHPRTEADGSALAACDGLPCTVHSLFHSAHPFRHCRPTALDGATKAKLTRPPLAVFLWKLFLSPGNSDTDGSPWTSRTVLHASTNRSTMPTNCPTHLLLLASRGSNLVDETV